MFKSILILNVIFIKAIKLIMKICVINIPFILGKTVFIKNEKEMTIYTFIRFVSLSLKTPQPLQKRKR